MPASLYVRILILHYRGPLRANGSPEHKHELRQAFHSQLRQLWSQPPLSEEHTLLKPREKNGHYSLLRPVSPFTFVPLVTSEMNGVAELRVTILRPESPATCNARRRYRQPAKDTL